MCCLPLTSTKIQEVQYQQKQTPAVSGALESYAVMQNDILRGSGFAGASGIGKPK